MWTNILNFDKRGNKIPLVKFPKPSLRFAPNFNGVSQYAIVNAQVLSGQVFTFNLMVGSLSSTGFVFDGNQPRSFCYIDSNNTVFFQGVTLKINGVAAVNGVTTHIGDGIFEFTANQNLIIETIATRFTFAAFISALIYNFKVGNGSIYNYPMDDGWANNPTMRNTGSGADGTFVNMTEASWVEIQP